MPPTKDPQDIVEAISMGSSPNPIPQQPTTSISNEVPQHTTPFNPDEDSSLTEQQPRAPKSPIMDLAQPSPNPDESASAENLSDSARPSAPVFVDLTAESDDDDDAPMTTAPFSMAVEAVKVELNPEPLKDVDMDLDPTMPDSLQLDEDAFSSMPVRESIEETSAKGAPGEALADEQELDMVNMLQSFEKNTAIIAAHADHPSIDLDDDDSDEEDAHATAAFADIKEAYDAKRAAGTATLEDRIEFTKRQGKELDRRQLRKEKQDYREQEFREEHAMFIPETAVRQHTGSPDDSDAYIVSSRTLDLEEQHNTGGYREISEIEAKGESDNDTQQEYDEDEDEDQGTGVRPNSKRGRGGSSRSHRKPATTKKLKGASHKPKNSTRGGSGRGRGRGRKSYVPRSLFNMTSLLPYNIITQANENAEAEAQPGFKSHRRKDALAELIASLPVEEQRKYKDDEDELRECLKQFRTYQSIVQEKGKFRLREMKTSLHNFQVVGAANMRFRERQGDPFGGLLADEMGLGKTIMSIANIIDGRPDDEEQLRATLIVAPNAILTQWMHQITQHSGNNYPKNYTIFKSRNLAGLGYDPVAMLGSFDIVITSYSELLKSMPKKLYPAWLTTPAAKEKWWEDHFQATKGILHQVKWRRIILDEAQQIKNHESRTSESAWRLSGKYRWAITGTPVLNSIEEFYAFFRFLKVKNTGDFTLWKDNYCKKGSAAALKRLNTLLQKFMIRRTHQDKMFGKPIVQLPRVTQSDLYLDFNPIEKAVYEIVRERFVAKINGFAKSGTINKNYTFIFVLLLRLRQLTANILLIQKTLKDLLERPDLKKLWALTESSDPELAAAGGGGLLLGLQEGLRNLGPSDRANEGGTTLSSVQRMDESVSTNDVSGAATHRFQKYLQSMLDQGKSDNANREALCHFCSQPPENRCITPCGHVYCYACLMELSHTARAQHETMVRCTECGTRFNKIEAFPDESTSGDRSESATPGVDVQKRRRSTPNSASLEEDIDWLSMPGPVLHSTKVIAAIDKMEKWFEADPETKVLVFSQWRALIKIFMLVCREKKWGQAAFHGALSFEARDAAIQKFSTDPKCKVLIAAMKAGGVGLNLTAANKVILIDLWWNSAMETQAFCRAFRIGQEREVEIVRLIIKNTIDTKMIAMQRRKDAEIAAVMDSKNREAAFTSKELLALFGIGDGDDDDDDGQGGDANGFIFPEDVPAGAEEDE
ncbi:uncharacterized protein HMPREF1541_04154 [Cyphellophora europaea CBS 101466]|uniref:Uncharacterized protein n=1 Tax=Cyphellophora europaea (strain CBS 101466) TaxID=1220924 RepID=W2S2D1_CYPE1|nr:uncharacterized protein HMPREF1541_04154 [Cyphellophora europaea CBS 101466]ETN42213.1 hypothetical protein HMPREF1541_04154 [Cyphellophora europaea CBS 101466]